MLLAISFLLPSFSTSIASCLKRLFDTDSVTPRHTVGVKLLHLAMENSSKTTLEE